MLLHNLLEQFENISGAEKLGPVSSMMLITLWRKAEKLKDQSSFQISCNELMTLSGITRVNDFQQALNRLLKFGYIRTTTEVEVGEGVHIELNLNLYEPFKLKEIDEHKHMDNIVDALESVYIRLRGSGVMLSPLEYDEIRNIAESGISLQDSVRLLEECFEEYIPKYKNDRIRSFKYCARYITSRHSQELAKKGVYLNGEHEGIDTQTKPKKPIIPEEIQRYRERLKERGLLRGRSMGDIKCDF